MRSDKRVRIAKANGTPDDEKVYRLTDIEPQFVSLVTAGANRQKKFQVVKADEAGLGPGGVCVCVECGNEEPHETGVKCNELTCSKCGGTMARKDETAVQEAKDRIADKTEDDGDDSAPEDGANSKGAVDTLAWLDEAGSRVGDMFVSLALESPDALGVSTSAATVNTAQKAQVDDSTRNAPSVKQLTEKVSEIESDLRVAKADRDALEKERDNVAKERDQLAKANAELRKERDKLKVQLAKVRKGLGGPTALVTGMVAQQQKKRSDDDDDGPLWASGGDLAQKATKKQTG